MAASISRLAELRAFANLQVSGQAETLEDRIAKDAASRKEDPRCTEVVWQESMCRSDVEKVQAHTSRVRDLALQLKNALLPKEIEKLREAIRWEEARSLEMIKTAQTRIKQLRETSAWGEGPTLTLLRQNFAEVLQVDLEEESEAFFLSRTLRHQEQQVITYRHVKYTYPHAKEEYLKEAAAMPEYFSYLMEYRLSGDSNMPLHSVLKELENSKEGLEARLEAQAQELELIFYQFHMLTGQNDKLLGKIEENVSGALQETMQALDNLKSANEVKSSNERMRAAMLALLILIPIVLVLYYAGGKLLNFYEDDIVDDRAINEAAKEESRDPVSEVARRSNLASSQLQLLLEGTGHRSADVISHLHQGLRFLGSASSTSAGFARQRHAVGVRRQRRLQAATSVASASPEADPCHGRLRGRLSPLTL